MGTLRLVQMVVQPVLVLDDGESLSACEVQPIVVTAADWPAFSAEKWPEVLAAAEAQIEAQARPEMPASEHPDEGGPTCGQ